MTTPRDALASALATENVRRWVGEAWVDSGVSEPGYATPDEQADAILTALAAEGWVLTRESDAIGHTHIGEWCVLCVTHGYKQGFDAPAPDPAPLDVERLARALRAWGGPGHSYWRVPAWPLERTDEAAAAIAREYAAIAAQYAKEPQP